MSCGDVLSSSHLCYQIHRRLVKARASVRADKFACTDAENAVGCRMLRLLARSIRLSIACLGLPLHAASSDRAPSFLERAGRFAAEEQALGIDELGEKLLYRIQSEPFFLIATLIFFLAIVHTFAAVPLSRYAHKVAKRHESQARRHALEHGVTLHPSELVSFKATVLHFFGEIEAIFGIWALVLLGCLLAMHGLEDMERYVMSVTFTEPLFVFVIMTIAATRPVLRCAETLLQKVARLGKETPAAWWLVLMIVAPLLGSFITEPGAMTIAALLLARKFYPLQPSPRFAYATLGLLFVNISIGGVLTHFAAPPVLMVAEKWHLTTPEMFMHFGDKAILAIVVSSLGYYAVFRRELQTMALQVPDRDGDGVADWSQRGNAIPWHVTIVHLTFLAWTVYFSHYPPLFLGAFLFFIAYNHASAAHQNPLELRSPLMVGFFLASLVLHGAAQGWWLSPIIQSLGEWPLFFGATLLTSFNDNAAITYLASQVEPLSPALKYAVLAGAITGGGLTVIANAPNPAGQAILSRFFGDGVSPLKLAVAALSPTLIVILCLQVIPDSAAHRQLGEERLPITHEPATSETLSPPSESSPSSRLPGDAH